MGWQMIIVKIIIRQIGLGRIIIRPYDDNTVDVFRKPIFGLRIVFGEYGTKIVLTFLKMSSSMVFGSPVRDGIWVENTGPRCFP